MIVKLIKSLWRFLLNIIFFMACLVPKNKKLWLFGAWNGKKFSDNPKYVYLYVLEHHSEIKPIWIAKSKALYHEMNSKGLPVVYAFDLIGIWYQMRAAAIIYTHAIYWEFIPFLVGATTKRIQAWHGTPLKKIGYDDTKAGNTRYKEQFYSLFIPYLSERCDLVLASGVEDQENFRTAFNVKTENVIITGYPRNDQIFRSIKAGEHTRRIIYMPTFRGGVNSEFKLLHEAGFDFEVINHKLKSMDAELYIKLHPVQFFSDFDLAAISNSSHIFTLANDGDIYETIGLYDVLITDFSSIYFDYLITGRPVVMAPFDLQDYLKNDRELYYDYEDICPSEPCYSWDAVFDRVLTEWQLRGSAQPSIRYLAVQKIFHKYIDDQSSLRVFNEIHNVIFSKG